MKVGAAQDGLRVLTFWRYTAPHCADSAWSAVEAVIEYGTR
jgi:hypothetical protein